MELESIPELLHGRTWEEMPVGFTFRTSSRTLTEADVRTFINVVGINEPLFYDAREAATAGYERTPVPGMMTFATAEGLVIQSGSIHGTGMAFVHSDLDIKGPVYIGDTLTVVVEVTESRSTSKPGRGLVTTRNTVVNQHDEVVMVYHPVRLTKGKEAT